MAKKAMTGKQKAAAEKAGKTGETAAKETAAKPVALVSINPKAMSVDVGPMVIAGLAKNMVDEAKAVELAQSVKSKRYDLMAQLTYAISKAAKVDGTIDLTATFTGDQKKMGVLNDQLGLALGFREKKSFDTPKGTVERIATAKAVEKFFPTNKDRKDSPEKRQKTTFQSNFLHLLKKCAQAAVRIADSNIDMELDKDSGTLLISGPAVKKQFGADEVLLDERQTVGDGKDKIKLLEKPSFTALASAAAIDHGAAVKRGGQVAHRGQKIVANNPDALIKAQCDALIASIGKLKGAPSDKQTESLTALRSAIDKVLD